MADNSGYELGYDKDGNVVLVPSQPKAKAAPRSRMSEGFSEAYGTPMGISEKDRAAYPAFSMVAGPVATAIDAARRLPGAIAGGISGGVGDLVEGATGDSGYANRQQRQTQALLDYLGLEGMARSGGPGQTVAARTGPQAFTEANRYAQSLETPSSGMTANRLAMEQNRNPGRYVNPETGMPQSVQSPLTGRAAPAMGRTDSPYPAMWDRLRSAPGDAFDYLTQRQAVVNPDTGYVLRVQEQGPNWGKKREGALGEWTTGQRVAQAAVPLAAGTAIGAAMAPSQGTAIPANYAADSGAAPAPLSAGAGRGFLNERPGERYATMVGAGRGIVNEQPGERAAYAQQQAVNAAKQRMAAAQATGERAGLPPARPDDADGGLFSKIFSGKDYQSNSQLVNTPTGGAPINWGSSDSAADFFRADKALAQMKAQQAADAASGGDDNRKRGGSVTGKGQGQSEKMPDPIHKALEIIHHLLIRH